MSILHKITLIVFLLSFFTFVALFGRLPALRKTPIGWLQRALCLHIPNGLRALDRTATGGRVTLKSKRLGRYLFYESNPIVLVLFLFVLTGSAGLFLRHATHRLPTSLLLPIPILLPAPYIFTYLSTVHTAHYITSSSRDPHTYPYDHILFRPCQICRTCEITKPARSKHCSFCRACVAKCDHHCPWVNNCLGRGNYRHFLFLLLTLSALEFYGAFCSWYILRRYLRTSDANPFFSGAHLNALGDSIVRAVNVGGLSIAGVGMLTASTAFLPLGLLAYHCYLIWAGMTTNESSKWADWQDDMADGLVFISSRKAIRAHLKERQSRHDDSGMRSGMHALGLTADESDEPGIPWPIGSDQMVVRTNDGHPPRGQEGLWRRVRGLDEVENVYDLGGWQNFVEVLKGR